ncbi:MAG: hypothetical protein LBB13_00945 [Rickettsiales bacterium]|nr:hypothetical protein [Rickettsiales bacterium]
MANGKYYGIKLPIASAKIDKNCFDVIIVKKISIMSMIMYFFTKNDNRNIIKLTNKNQVIIESINDNYPLQVDGDYCCNLPVKIESNDSYINVYHL